jgi:protein-S-isoprenylcysteine O-methyltransferase Ste14
MRTRGLQEGIVDFIHRTATGPNRVRVALVPLFALFFFCLILMFITVSFYLDKLFGFTSFLPKPYGMAVSLPFLAGGALLWSWSVWRFLKTKGTPVPVLPPPVLVTDGPYAYSRNPMLTGVFLTMAGIGILCGSVWLTFVMTPLFVGIAVIEFKYIEEPELERRFGRAYVEYRKRTPLVIPRIRPGIRTGGPPRSS